MASSNERRRTIRIAVHGNLLVESVSPGVTLRLVDVGTGGFAVQSRSSLPIGVVGSYRISTPDGKWSAIFRARALHCKTLQVEGSQAAEYMTGLAFVTTDSSTVQREITTMMDYAMSFVSFS